MEVAQTVQLCALVSVARGGATASSWKKPCHSVGQCPLPQGSARLARGVQHACVANKHAQAVVSGCRSAQQQWRDGSLYRISYRVAKTIRDGVLRNGVTGVSLRLVVKMKMKATPGRVFSTRLIRPRVVGERSVAVMRVRRHPEHSLFLAAPGGGLGVEEQELACTLVDVAWKPCSVFAWRVQRSLRSSCCTLR